MVLTELATTKIKELLQNNNANFLNFRLAGNVNDGYFSIITFLNVKPKEFITITTEPGVLVDPRSYIKLANSILDFDEITNELKIHL